MRVEAKRQYREVGESLKEELAAGKYAIGSRLPPERDMSERMGVGRAVIREALIMLEIEGYIEVRKGSGIYVIALPETMDDTTAPETVMGPFELLQARQLLESNIAEFAAIQVTPPDIHKMKAALETEKKDLESGESENGDMLFHRAIAEATHNNMLIQLWELSWKSRENNPMWKKLHQRITGHAYRVAWLQDHLNILMALQKKDPQAAKRAMWQHLENVKEKLMELSDVDSPEFDGYLFSSYPVATA